MSTSGQPAALVNKESEKQTEAQLSKRERRQKPVCSSPQSSSSGKKLSRDKKLRLPASAGVAEVEMFRIAGAAGSHCFLPGHYFVVSKVQ